MTVMSPFSDADPVEVDEMPGKPQVDNLRKPRVAIMGEFSAGKSTLSNLLLGARPLPEKVTATRLSPVWIAKGSGLPYRVGTDGTEETILLDDIESVPVEETHVIRMFLEAEILNYCDLIDFPGISDPNMDSIVWERVLNEVDMILWCTHATQAWRQSESAVWDMIPDAVRDRSVLLITRFDKLTTERDRAKVLHRVTAETEGLFEAIFPISLTQALAAADDPDKWIESGADAFADHLIAHLQSAIIDPATSEAPATSAPSEPAPAHLSRPGPTEPEAPAAPRIVPRRVRAAGGSRPRPAS